MLLLTPSVVTLPYSNAVSERNHDVPPVPSELAVAVSDKMDGL